MSTQNTFSGFEAWNTSIASGDLPAIQNLIQRKELKLKDSIGDLQLSPLHLAVIHNQPEICEYLISEGISPNISEGSTAKTPLHLAAYFGHISLVEELIKKGASYCGKKGADVLGCLPLHYAALAENEKMIFLFLREGHLRSPGERDLFGVSKLSRMGNILDILIRKGNYELSDLFSSAGGINSVETNPRIQSTLYVGYRNEHPWTPIHSAAILGKQKILEMLVRKFPHASCFFKEYRKHFDFTPGEVALMEGYQEVAVMLEEHRSITECRQRYGDFIAKQNCPSYASELLKAILERNTSALSTILDQHGESILYEKRYDHHPQRSFYYLNIDLDALSLISRSLWVSAVNLFESRNISIQPTEFLHRDTKEKFFFNWAFMNVNPLATGFFNQVKKLCF